jgi:hypothetical protein
MYLLVALAGIAQPFLRGASCSSALVIAIDLSFPVVTSTRDCVSVLPSLSIVSHLPLVDV